MQSYEKRTWWAKHRVTERLKSDEFLGAAISAAYLIAIADSEHSPEEYDALVDRLQILGDVDRDKIEDHLSSAANDYEGRSGDELVDDIRQIVTDPEGARAVLMFALSVSLADELSTEEREMAKRLADGIGLRDVDLDSVIAEIRG